MELSGNFLPVWLSPRDYGRCCLFKLTLLLPSVRSQWQTLTWMDFYGYFNPVQIQSGHFAWSSESRYFLESTHTHTCARRELLSNNFHHSVGKQKSIIAFHFEAFFLSAEKKGVIFSCSVWGIRASAGQAFYTFMKRYIHFKLFFDGGRGEKHETHENFNYFTYTVIKVKFECRTFTQCGVFSCCIGTLVKVLGLSTSSIIAWQLIYPSRWSSAMPEPDACWMSAVELLFFHFFRSPQWRPAVKQWFGKSADPKSFQPLASVSRSQTSPVLRLKQRAGVTAATGACKETMRESRPPRPPTPPAPPPPPSFHTSIFLALFPSPINGPTLPVQNELHSLYQAEMQVLKISDTEIQTRGRLKIL